MNDGRDCYGCMLPDLDTVERNREGWAQCRACESYRDCYEASMAKLALGTALHART